jgi:hypothetical protein
MRRTFRLADFALRLMDVPAADCEQICRLHTSITALEHYQLASPNSVATRHSSSKLASALAAPESLH